MNRNKILNINIIIVFVEQTEDSKCISTNDNAKIDAIPEYRDLLNNVSMTVSGSTMDRAIHLPIGR